MTMRRGLGPVFRFESILASRRWQLYAMRSVFVLVLLVGMVLVWVGIEKDVFGVLRGQQNRSFAQMALIGRWFFYALTCIQITLILLAAPAYAAGSFGGDRARGVLWHIMVTDLSDTEIVLGTLAARVAPTVGMIVCGVPVTALAALLGGIEPAALAASFTVSLSLAVLCGAVALVLSVWVAKMHEVLLVLYVAEFSWLLALPIWYGMAGGPIAGPPAWFEKANPFVTALAPYNRPGFVTAGDLAAFAAAALGLSALLATLAIARLRRVLLAQSGSSPCESRRLPELKRLLPSWPSPTLAESNPVLWREWHRSRPSRLTRRLWGLILLVTWSLAAWGTYRVITEGVTEGSGPLDAGLQFQVLFGMLMLAVTAPTALAEERVRGSLDVLLTTPLSTRSIVVAKWWGGFRRVLALLPLPLFTAVFLSASTPNPPPLPAWATTVANYPAPAALTTWDYLYAATFCPADFLASGALIVGVGLLLATWVRRLGRAVALSAVFYVLAGIVWVFLVELSFAVVGWFLPNSVRDWFNDNFEIWQCVAGLSPVFGPLVSVNTNWQQSGHRGYYWAALGLVLLVKAAAAAFLLWLSIKTFDRCLGRVPESGARPRGVPQGTSPQTLGDWNPGGLGAALGGTASRASSS
jgi:ABC-type transport system involved in multi-copper enzyme maturation permease subunit